MKSIKIAVTYEFVFKTKKFNDELNILITETCLPVCMRQDFQGKDDYPKTSEQKYLETTRGRFKMQLTGEMLDN